MKPLLSNPAQLSAAFTVAMVTLMLAVKALAYFNSGAASVLASFTDSLLDSTMSLVTLLVVFWSQKPADDDHRYGHGKIEGVAALLQAGLIVGAAFFIGLEGVQRLVHAEPIDNHISSVGLLLFCIVLTIAMVLVQKFFLTKTNSLALKADHAHYTNDIFLNGSVVASLMLSHYGAPQWVDVLLAILIAAMFVRAAIKMGHEGVDMLMDKQVEEPIRKDITEIIARQEGILGMHDLRVTLSGTRHMISFDVEMDPSLLLWTAHEMARTVEKSILEKYPNADIIIHIDPYGDTADARH